MNQYRVTLDTPKGERWFLVEANSPEAARIEAQGAFPEQADMIAKIKASGDEDLDPKLHIDN